jgi:hypothetical protein
MGRIPGADKPIGRVGPKWRARSSPFSSGIGRSLRPAAEAGGSAGEGTVAVVVAAAPEAAQTVETPFV